MKHRVTRMAWLIAGAVSVMLAGTARSREPQHKSVLADIKALDQPVTYTETKIPLGELVQKVAAATGAPLTAAPDVADEPVAVVIKELPARELLEQLADLLDYRWHQLPGHPTPTVEIYQDLAAKQRQAALRQTALADADRRLREKALQYSQMARLSPAQIQAIVAAGEQRERALGQQSPEQQRAFDESLEGAEWRERLRIAQELTSPVACVVAGLLGDLSSDDWAALYAGRTLSFSSQPGPEERPLPGEAARRLHSSPLSPSRIVFGSVDAEQMEKDRQAQWLTAAGYRVSFNLGTGRYRTHGQLSLGSSVEPFLSGPAPPGTMIFVGEGSLSLPMGPVGLTQVARENTPERRAALERDPITSRRATLQPAGRPGWKMGEESADRAWLARDLLPDLARAYHVQLIADAYWSDDYLSGLQFPPEPRPLYQWLDTLTSIYDRWERHGSLVRVRSRTWFFDRPREVPLRLIRRWQESYHERGGLSLEDCPKAATALTDLQLQCLPELAVILVHQEILPPGADELEALSPARHALRLLASLAPAQQERLFDGAPLLLSQTTAPQRAHFLAALEEWARRGEGPVADAPAPGKEETFSVARKRYVRAQDEENGPIFLREETLPSPPATRPPAAATPPPAGRGAPTRSLPLPRPAGSRRHRFVQVEFTFAAGPEWQKTVCVPIAASP